MSLFLPYQSRRIQALSRTDLSIKTAPGTSFTFSGLSFGSPHASRIIACMFSGWAGSAGTGAMDATLLKVNGVDVLPSHHELSVGPSSGTGPLVTVVAVSASVPGGTTGTVEVTFTKSLDVLVLVLYRLICDQIHTDGDTDAIGSPLSLDVSMPEGGAFIGVTANNNNGSNSWSGATEDLDATQGGLTYSTAYALNQSEDANLNITSTLSDSSGWEVAAGLAFGFS